MAGDYTPQQYSNDLEKSGDFSRITEGIEPLMFDPQVRRKSNRSKTVDQAVLNRDNGGCMKNACCVF